jgi:hypothetical protein
MRSKASLSWSLVMAFYRHLLTLGLLLQFGWVGCEGEILLREDLLEKLQSAGIVGLAEPKHGLFAHFGIAVGLGDFD